MSNSEYEKKRNEAISLTDPDGMGDYSPKQMEASFKAGSDFGREYQRGVEDKSLSELVDCTKDISSWLKRMSVLNWGDPEYAPNFKLSAIKLDRAIEAYNKSKDVKP